MDVRIEGLHEKALLRLMEQNSEKTVVSMVRILIRDAAKEAGLWPVYESVPAHDTEPAAHEVAEPVVA